MNSHLKFNIHVEAEEDSEDGDVTFAHQDRASADDQRQRQEDNGHNVSTPQDLSHPLHLLHSRCKAGEEQQPASESHRILQHPAISHTRLDNGHGERRRSPGEEIKRQHESFHRRRRRRIYESIHHDSMQQQSL